MFFCAFNSDDERKKSDMAIREAIRPQLTEITKKNQ